MKGENWCKVQNAYMATASIIDQLHNSISNFFVQANTFFIQFHFSRGQQIHKIMVVVVTNYAAYKTVNCKYFNYNHLVA